MTVDVNTIIKDAAERVNKLAEKSDAMAQAAMSATSGAAGFAPFVASAGVPSGPGFQGNVNLSHDFLGTYSDALRDMRPEFANAIAEYIARWFPACVFAHTEDWICNTILTGGTGLPPGIEEAIWERARRREAREAYRLEQEALTQGAARGFMIPPGAVTYRMLQVQQDSVDRQSSANRDEAIKHIDIIIENVRFAVEEGVKVRGQVMSALGDYIRAHFLPEEMALQKADGILKAKSVLVNSAADYYRAQVAAASLQVEAQAITGRSYDAANSAAAQYAIAMSQTRSAAATSISNTYGQAAAGAASGILGVGQDQVIRVGGLA